MQAAFAALACSLMLVGCSADPSRVTATATPEFLDPAKEAPMFRDDVRRINQRRAWEGRGFDCDDFDSWEKAQWFYEINGGHRNDKHRLDADGDGVACEALR